MRVSLIELGAPTIVLGAGIFLACQNEAGARDDGEGSGGTTGDLFGSGGSGAASGSGSVTGSGGTSVEPVAGCEKGYRELADGRGGVNVEQVCWEEGTIDKVVSRAAFEEHLYPLLLENCSDCHSTATRFQSPMHSDLDPEVAHEYALTRVNFRSPKDSKFVVRMGIDRHNCFGNGCKDAESKMLTAVTAWANAVAPSLKPFPTSAHGGQTVSEATVLGWIDTDKGKVSEADRPYTKYVSFHELHNEGKPEQDLDTARVALSKALNSTARWAPAIKNPVDVSGEGLVYRIDTRDYWGFNKGVTKLHFGGSDDDVFFGRTSVNYLGEPVTSNVTTQENYPYTAEVSVDPSFATLVWGRVLAGNVEGATDAEALPPNIDGFHADYVEAGQLVYTLTRPDVYNAIMAIPWYADQLEEELGVVKDAGIKSYEYMLTKQAITVDSRLFYRAKTSSQRYYWKTWDVFTGQLDGVSSIEQAYEEGKIRFPFWAHPIPKFVSNFGIGGGDDLSFIATLAQTSKDSEPEGCEGQPNYGDENQLNCLWYTGTAGLQQSAEEVIFGLPNGLQGYALFGGLNQRRVDAFVNIVRDPRILRDNSDAQIGSSIGFATFDRRLNTGSSCIGCHADGMNRADNDLRDWLDFDRDSLPHGARGVDSWIDDETIVSQVKELYPPSTMMRPKMEDDRRPFLAAEAEIKRGIMRGPEKNVYVEPTIWLIEWARAHYAYPTTRSN